MYDHESERKEMYDLIKEREEIKAKQVCVCDCCALRAKRDLLAIQDPCPIEVDYPCEIPSSASCRVYFVRVFASSCPFP